MAKTGTESTIPVRVTSFKVTLQAASSASWSTKVRPARRPRSPMPSTRRQEDPREGGCLSVLRAHVHPLKTHRRLADEGLGRDALLLVADLDRTVRQGLPTAVGGPSSMLCSLRLTRSEAEPPFTSFIPAVPDEAIAAGEQRLIGPTAMYGARPTVTSCVTARP